MTLDAHPHLASANRKRIAMAQAKREIANGTRSARKIIGDPPELLRNMKLIAVLQSIRWIGSQKAVTICSRARVNPLAKIGDLTDQQRLRILDRLDADHPSTREA